MKKRQANNIENHSMGVQKTTSKMTIMSISPVMLLVLVKWGIKNETYNGRV